MAAGGLWRISLTAPAGAAPALADALGPHCVAVSWSEADGGPVSTVEGLADAEPSPAALADALRAAAGAVGVPPPRFAVAWLPGRDWLAENQRTFPPIAAGRFLIHGSHEAAPPVAGRIAIELDAATAFGSGSHGSTRGCLLAIERLYRRRRYRRVLDLGCGSAILAIAAAKLGATRVLAADVDPEAARVAAVNLRRNRVAGRARAAVSDGLRAPAARRAVPFDLIVANILARPLVRLAPTLARALAPQGALVLGGFVAADRRWLQATYRAQGLAATGGIIIDGWATLALEKRGEGRAGKPGGERKDGTDGRWWARQGLNL